MTRQADLRAKVSKERIGIEVSKMMKHHPFRAIQLIHDHDLYSSIFQSSLNPPNERALRAAQILDKIGPHLLVDELLWLAAATAPFDGLTIKTKREQPAVLVVLAEALKVRRSLLVQGHPDPMPSCRMPRQALSVICSAPRSGSTPVCKSARPSESQCSNAYRGRGA